MLSENEFITMSLDLNLFFLRIMKEHCFFLGAGFGPIDDNLAREAAELKKCFGELLSEAVCLADGNVSREALNSGQFATRYTAQAEKLTHFYTGADFDTGLTCKELLLSPRSNCSQTCAGAVAGLNREAYRTTAALADFKCRLLRDVTACRLFTFNYPLLIEHILREAKFYMRMLECLNNRRPNTGPGNRAEQELFWNRQMAEHAKFIAGLLDPSEENLIDAARMFGKEFDELTCESKRVTQIANDMCCRPVDSITAMKRLREFKTDATRGLLNCSIKSIIIPLLGDHVLREANHYLCVLGVCCTQVDCR
jgi:hypothetical protein